MSDRVIVLDTAVITSLRFILFFSCRKFLLSSLYHDLRDLSSNEASATPRAVPTTTRPSNQHIDSSEDSDIELDNLPLPSTQAAKSSYGGGRSSLHSALARTSFAVCFSESCIMFLMLMAQGLNIFDPRARIFNWRISLFLLLSTLMVFIPLALSLILTIGPSSASGQRQRQRSVITRMIIYLSPVALYFFLLSYIPLPSALSSQDIITAALSRLIVLGTVILGLLSGFGAISNAWAFFPLFSSARHDPTDEDIRAAEQALLRISNDLAERRAEAQRRAASQPKTDATWFSRVVPSFRGGDDHAQEMKGLEPLEYQMARNLEALKQRRDYAKFSASLKGKLFNWGGRLFAIYCIFRVISSVINIFKPARNSTNYPDIITHLLAYLVSLLPSIDVKMDDVALLSRQISLGLVGLIILSSVRLVLRGVTRVLRITSKNLGASLMLLILAQLMGIYLLSTVVQLRTTFPPPPSRPDLDQVTVNLFTTIPEYEVFGSLFDWSFLFSGGATAFGRWATERVNGVEDG